LCAFTAQRIGNVVSAKWEEFDLDAEPATWTIPRRQMKVKERHHDHRVILGPTIAAELRRWRQDSRRSEGHVFPSPTGRPHITRESLEKVYRVTLGLGGKHSLHGWRASFSTLANDAGFESDAVDLFLDHVHRTATARAYDRGERLEDRIRLARWWDEQLAPLADDPKVLPLRVTG
jgi:integrase